MSCLDHACNNFHVTSQSFIINPTFPDHCPIFILFNLNLSESELNSVILIRLIFLAEEEYESC